MGDLHPFFLTASFSFWLVLIIYGFSAKCWFNPALFPRSRPQVHLHRLASLYSDTVCYFMLVWLFFKNFFLHFSTFLNCSNERISIVIPWKLWKPCPAGRTTRKANTQVKRQTVNNRSIFTAETRPVRLFGRFHYVAAGTDKKKDKQSWNGTPKSRA